MNHFYEVRGDRATGCATTVVSISTPGGYKITGQSVYEDDLLKVDGEWKICRRWVKNDYLVSDPAKPVNFADPDVASLVREPIDAADDLAQRAQRK